MKVFHFGECMRVAGGQIVTFYRKNYFDLNRLDIEYWNCNTTQHNTQIMFKAIFKEMFHPSKAAIISSLKRSNGLPVSEIAKEVEMSYMGVKQHCINLEKQGFVESWRVPRKEVGRPEKLYRLTDKSNDLFPVAGVNLTLSLLAAAKDALGESAPEKLLLKYFSDKKVSWSKQLSKKKNVADKAQRLSELREEDGFFNALSFDKTYGLIIKEYHNPLQEIYNIYPKVQRFEIEMIEELLGTSVKHEITEGVHGQKLSQFEISSLGKAA